MASDRLYDFVGVLDHNIRPAVRGRGSAIFFHVATEDLAPTAGCVALRARDLARLLPRLARRATSGCPVELAEPKHRRRKFLSAARLKSASRAGLTRPARQTKISNPTHSTFRAEQQ